MEEEEEFVLVAKKTICPWEERLMIMLVLGLFNAVGQIQNRLLNCCKLIRPTVLLLLKGKH